MQDLAAICQRYLNILYSNVSHQNTQYKPQEIAYTHGEILYESVEKLMAVVPFSPNDIFVDLGSGRGRVVSQVFLRSQVKEACGIEFLSDLHRQAITVGSRIQQDFPELYANERKLTFLEGDFFKIPFSSASIVFVNSTCFNQHILYSLCEIIDRMPAIKQILSLRPMPALKRHSFKKAVRIECSWDTALCYIYRSF